MNRTLWLLFALLFALAPAAALAAPGDGAPPDMGDDDDDDDDDEDSAPGDSAPPSMDEDEEEEAEPEPEAESEDDEDADDEDADDEDADDEDADDEEAAPEENEDELDDRYSLPPLDDSEDEAEEEADEEPARVRRSDSDFEEEDEEEEEEAAADKAPEKRRGLVKVIQRKFFLKYRRVEITPMIGGMLTDDFINRLAVGVMLDIHVNDILAIEFLGNFLPDLQATDYKPLTNRLKNRDEVVPEVSRIVGLFTTNLSLSPIYGKIELGTLRIINYDIYVSAGVGFVSTVDDTLLVEETSPCHGNTRAQNQALPECQYINQEHFVTSIGAGFRVVFNDFIGIRLDGRGFAHVETLYRDDNNNPEVGLDMKQNFQLSFGVSFFVPPTARTVQ